MQIFKTSKAKENILGKLRKTLGTEATPMPFPDADKQSDAGIFSADADLSEEERFAGAFIDCGGRFVYCDHEQEMLENIYALYENKGWEYMLCAEPRLMQLFFNNKMDILRSAEEGTADAAACITGCDALVARSGAVVLSSRQLMGRIAPVYYPVHIIVAYKGQLVSDVQAAIELVKKRYGNELPSMINFNAGPSRTADIEKTLVTGVHGPAEVFLFYVNAE